MKRTDILNIHDLDREPIEPDGVGTVADFVSRVQYGCRGVNFCAMKFDIIWPGLVPGIIVMEPATYSPAKSLWPRPPRPENALAYRPRMIFEHFLQSVRDMFPDKPFQLLRIYIEDAPAAGQLLIVSTDIELVLA